MLKKIYLWLRGYVQISVQGKNAGRFINLCTNRGIKVWNIHSISWNSYSCFLFVRDFFKIKQLVRKTRVKIIIFKKYGFPFFLHRYRFRFCFVCMLIGISCLLWYSTCFVWKIEITGNSYLTEEILIDYLAENGNGFGTKKSSIDCDALENSLRNDFPEIIWTSAYIEGTKLVLIVQENLCEKSPVSKSKDANLQTSYTNLVATKDAMISSIITRSGTPCVITGDHVLQGDVLVHGICEIVGDDGEVANQIYVNADADIFGYVTYTYQDIIPVEYVYQTPKKKAITSYRISLFDRTFSLPFHPYKEEEHLYIIEEYSQLCISDNIYLPVFLEKISYQPQEEYTMLLSQEQAKTFANEHFHNFLEELEENGVSIVDKNVIMRKEGNEYVVSGSVSCIEEITQTQEMDIINSLQDTETISIDQEGT